MHMLHYHMKNFVIVFCIWAMHSEYFSNAWHIAALNGEAVLAVNLDANMHMLKMLEWI